MSKYIDGNYYAGADLTKPCSVCKQEFNLSFFYKQTDGKFGTTSRCKTCHQKSNFAWAQNNKEKRNASCRKRLENKQAKKRALEATQQWRLRNLWYDAYRQRLRTATKNRATPKWADKEKIKEIYKTCPSGFHVEHNLQHLPAKENLSKRNKYVEVY